MSQSLSMSNKINLELHIHTTASKESTNDFEKILKTAAEQHIRSLAICDHNTISGALYLSKTSTLQIIIGEEIDTQDGEIIGFFLQKPIEPHLSLKETIHQIKQQHGIVYVPHPFDNMRKRQISAAKLDEMIDLIDIIETFNGRSLLHKYDKKAEAFAKKHDKIGAAGSDAHIPQELGKTYYEIEPFRNPQEFLEKIKNAKLHTKKSGPFPHIITYFKKKSKRFTDSASHDKV